MTVLSGLMNEKIYELFVGTNTTVRSKRLSVKRGSTVVRYPLSQLRELFLYELKNIESA